MLISYNFGINTAMYNRTYAPKKLQAKTLNITLSTSSSNTVASANLKAISKQFDFLNGGIIVNVQDTIMIDLLEPKAGNTVHNRLNELKRNLTDYKYEVIGDTIPSEVKNGYTLLVLGASYQVSLEGIAQFILREYEEVEQVEISDGNLKVVMHNSDIQQS